HRLSQPHVAPYDAVVTDDRGATKDGGARVDDHPVLDGRMPLAASVTLPHAEAAQGHALVERHVVTDYGSLADHHTGTVVDAEALADPGGGMDVDPGTAMSGRRQHARQEQRATAVQH